MEIRLTHHVKDRLGERGISTNQIIKTIKKPDKLAIDKHDNYLAVKYLNNHALVVVYREEQKTKIIITTYETSKTRVEKFQSIVKGD